MGADTVVVHPPFRWQRDYVRGFVDGIADLEAETGIAFAVENMYPWRASDASCRPTCPAGTRSTRTMRTPPWTCRTAPRRAATPIQMALDLGTRLHHVHMTDGSGSAKDEHLVPGRGNQPCGEFLELLAEARLRGQRGASRSTPGGRRTGPPGRPTSPSRSRSPGCISRPQADGVDETASDGLSGSAARPRRSARVLSGTV